MKAIFFSSLCLFFISVSCLSQDIEGARIDAEPVGGIDQLALVYYRIDFSKDQRTYLEGKSVEFIFLVDTTGSAVLKEVNGIDETAILDSLYKAKDLPLFNPASLNGEKQSVFYFMQITFPKYRVAPYHYTQRRFGRIRMDDLEYVNKTGVRLEIMFSGLANAFAGDPATYLSPGGGMKMDVVVKSRRKMGYGMMLAFCGNYMRKDYRIQTTRELESTPFMGFMGLIVNRQMFQRERREFNIHLEPAFASQTISTSKFRGDDYIQTNGFSPGVVFNYHIRFGREVFQMQMGGASISTHHLNFHAGIRPLFMDLKPVRGVMFELGIGYRLIGHFVSDFMFKEQLR